jgi:hypothetical protein
MQTPFKLQRNLIHESSTMAKQYGINKGGSLGNTLGNTLETFWEPDGNILGT